MREGNARGAQGNFPVVLASSVGSDSNYVGRPALEFIHFELFFLYAPSRNFDKIFVKKFCFKLLLFK